MKSYSPSVKAYVEGHGDPAGTEKDPPLLDAWRDDARRLAMLKDALAASEARTKA